MKNVNLFLLRDGHGNLNIIEIRPECFFGHQYRRNIQEKYFQQGYTGEAIFSTRFSLRIVKYFGSLTVHTVVYCRDTVE